MTSKTTDAIDVRAFHHVLLWPMLMRGAGENPVPHSKTAKIIDQFVDALSQAGWQEATTPDNSVHPDFTYEEIVYFHPFVRDFLFGDGRDNHESRAIRRFKRTDLSSIVLELEKFGSIQLKVERAELLLIRPQVVILLIEVSNRKPSADVSEPSIESPRTPMTLSHVLNLQCQLRHIYPPYFSGSAHGDCPLSVEWIGRKNKTEFSTSSDPDAFRQFVMTGAEPPIYGHWESLFNPPDKQLIRPIQSALNKSEPGLFLQQLLDCRMPGQSFISVDDPTAISQDDQDKLHTFDPVGFDYDPDFRAAHRSDFRYTRFRHWGTTYYCNGTSFALVCNSREFSNLLLNHFRRHYTHFAVIAHYQHAALLYFGDELAEVAKRIHPLSEKKCTSRGDSWQLDLEKLRHRFLKFRTRSYFTEVSNHIQAKDLFSLWFRHLGTKELFENVSNTCVELHAAAENEETKQLTKNSNYLENLASKWLPVLLMVDVFSMIFSCIAIYGSWSVSSPITVLSIAMLVFLVLIGYKLFVHINSNLTREKKCDSCCV